MAASEIDLACIVRISDMSIDHVCRGETVQRTASGKSGDGIVALQLVERDVWAILPESGDRLRDKVVVAKKKPGTALECSANLRDHLVLYSSSVG